MKMNLLTVYYSLKRYFFVWCENGEDPDPDPKKIISDPKPDP